MGRILQPVIFLMITTSTLQSEVKDPELPLCPTNVQYFPQELPMHCRMPRSPKYDMTPMPVPPFPPLPTFPPPPPGPWNDKPPQFPPIPPGYNFPGAVYPGPPPGALPMPMPMSMPMPMPMGMPPPPSSKLPVIVMPFYSPDPKYKDKDGKNGKGEKKERDKKDSGSDDSDCSDDDTDSDRNEYWRGSSRRSKHHRHHRRRGGKRSGRRGGYDGRERRRGDDGREMRGGYDGHEGRELLTPVIQYVTKDGYVIYEKEISKGEAKDWLNIKTKEDSDRRLTDVEDLANQEQLEQEVEDNMLKDKGRDMMERNPEIMLSQKPAAPVRHRRKKKIAASPKSNQNN